MNRRLLMSVVVVGQTINPSPTQLAHLTRPLQESEIAVVLSGVRSALATPTFRLSFPEREAGPEFLMRGDGRPARMRTTYGISGGGGTVGGPPRDQARTEWHDDFVDVVDYTGLPARRCDGTNIDGELVVTYEYRQSTKQWTARAATTALDWHGTPTAIGAPIFNMLSGDVRLSSETLRSAVPGRTLRSFTAPFNSVQYGQPLAVAASTRRDDRRSGVGVQLVARRTQGEDVVVADRDQQCRPSADHHNRHGQQPQLGED